MSALTFFPWVRSGVARQITGPDPLAAGGARASIRVTPRVNGAALAPITVRVHGPGDVSGFDPRHVVRTWPRAGATDAEPNLFPVVELDRPEFPWLFTPSAPAGAILRPWIVLVVVPRSAAALSPPNADGLPVLTIQDPAHAPLPDLTQSWAWAHAQWSGEVASGDALAAAFGAEPARARARLVCPIRLAPAVAYLACVVPAFVVAGNTLAPAWPANGPAPAAGLPVYHSWEFTTGPAGDFESLARRLQRVAAPPGIGVRRLDVGAAGPGLPVLAPDAPGAILDVAGPLVSPGTAPAWPDPPRSTYQAALRAVLDAPAALAASDPAAPSILAPPIYGRWYANATVVPADRPSWLRELNLDPRDRAVAGLGALVVQREQETFMAAAWDQVDRIREANARLAAARLARTAQLEVHRKRLGPLGPGALLQVTRPVHARVRMSPETLHAKVEASALPAAALSAAFRRLGSPRGAVGRRLLDAGTPLVPGRATERLARREVAGAPPPAPLPGTALLDGAAGAAKRPWLPRWLVRQLPRLLRYLRFAVIFLSTFVIVATSAKAEWGVVLFGALWLVVAIPYFVLKRLAPAALPGAAFESGSPPPDVIASAPPQPEFTVLPEGASPTDPKTTLTAGRDSPDAAAFREAAVAHQQVVVGGVAAGTVAPLPALEAAVPATLLARLDPSVTVAAATSGPAGTVQIDPSLSRPADPIADVMLCPDIPTPLAVPLARHAKEFLVGGADTLPAEAVTTLTVNARFVAAFMVGANHEMGRELLWREFPTDQRGTVFRQFWDPSSRIPRPTTTAEIEAARDVPPIHTWTGDAALGGSVRGASPGGTTVLVVRGALLRRYPNAIVYASRANVRPGEPGRRPADPPVERYPVFQGFVEPDLAYLGFDLSLAEARGGPVPAAGAPDPGPGWFFVLQEAPGDPRFGLDEGTGTEPLGSFSDVTWGHVTVTGDHVDLALPDGSPLKALRGPAGQTWGRQAGDMAFATLQRPFRVAISADDLLPEPT